MNLVILIEDEEFSSARSINTMDIKSLHFTFNISNIVFYYKNTVFAPLTVDFAPLTVTFIS